MSLPSPRPPVWRGGPSRMRDPFSPVIVLVVLAMVVTVALLLSAAHGQDHAVATTQYGVNANRSSVSASNTALTINFTAPTNQTVHLYGLSAFCSAGTASGSVVDSSTGTKWITSGGFFASVSTAVSWIPALTSSRGGTLAVTIGTCGGSNTSTANVQADIF